MFIAYLQISPYLQIYRSVSPDLQICIVTRERERALGGTSEEPGTLKQGVALFSLCVFITAVPLIKLFAWGEGVGPARNLVL
jgi:hypothetical protein